MTVKPRILRDPEFMQGAPRVEGTGFPTAIVRLYGFNRDAIMADYPTLAPEQVDAAIAYEQSWRGSFDYWREIIVWNLKHPFRGTR